MDRSASIAAARTGLGRRDFLRLGAGAAVGAGLGSVSAARVRPARPSVSPGQARNLIFMVSDGMSTGTLTLCDTVCRMRDGRPSVWTSLWERPGVRRTVQETQSADSFVTDSAAAASAWGCGTPCNNAVINITPEGRQLLPLLVHAQQNGKATGVVTTTRVTHATPAGFCANVPQRDLEGSIAQQLLERNIDVVLGGGEHFFKPDLLAKHPQLKLVRTKDELAAVSAADSTRLLGLFSRDHVPHVLDREPTVPCLEDMTRAALARLEKAPDGFAMQIEGGRVDHAAHDNDAASLVQEQLEFDRTLGVVLSWLEARDDTLLVVTTDHGNANPGLTLYGKRGEQGLRRLLEARHSFEWTFARLPKDGSPETLAAQYGDLVEQATGIRLDTEGVAMFARSMQSRRVMPFRDANSSVCVLGSLLATSFGVAFLSPNHTSDMVELTSIGPGSELLRPVMRNCEVWSVLTRVLGMAPGKLLPGMDKLVTGLPRGAGD